MLQPPTDNLYKFLAIFGLVVFGFSIFVPLQRLEEHSRELAKWNAAWTPLLQRALDSDDDEREALICAIAQAEKKRTKANSSECKHIEATRTERDQSSRDLQRAMAEQDSGRAMLAHLQQQFLIYRNIGFATAAFGLVCCVAGFWLWYVRVQRPLDAATAAQRASTSDNA